MTNWTTIVGLEAHVELSTKSKMFCSCSAEYFGGKPNTHTCPVCLGLPGALPVPNKKAVEWTILLGLALNCRINLESKFDRKNYFYPDLSKGYQISQYDEPLCQNGYLSFEVDGKEKTVRIRRVHLEEDTGKLLHQNIEGKNVSLVDFNRSGVPLIEIVTEPDIRNSKEADIFLKKLRRIVMALGISDADMEKGSMRLEPNISVVKFNKVHDESQIAEKDLPNYKVEVKNINSFRFVKKSIDFEVVRHINLLEKGETPKQETRGWNEEKKETISQRSKEEAADYRYFPEPDIPPMKFTEEQIQIIRSNLPKLPSELEETLVKTYSLRKEFAHILVSDPKLLAYFKQVIEIKDLTITGDGVASLLINKKVDIGKVIPEEFAKQIRSKQQSTVTNESELSTWIDQALQELPHVVTDYKAGKTQAIGVLIGKVMQLSNGKADASKIGALLRKKI